MRRTLALLLGVLGVATVLARPALAGPWEDRSAAMRGVYTAGAVAVNLLPVASAVVARQCLPGYIVCKIAYGAISLIAAGEQIFMSGGNDWDQTQAILYRGYGGDWYVTPKQVAGDEAVHPWPEPPASTKGSEAPGGWQPPPL